MDTEKATSDRKIHYMTFLLRKITTEWIFTYVNEKEKIIFANYKKFHVDNDVESMTRKNRNTGIYYKDNEANLSS